MKQVLGSAVLTAALACGGFANAGVISFATINDVTAANDWIITSNSGVNLSSGIAAVGYFGSSIVESNIATLSHSVLSSGADGFQILGSDNFLNFATNNYDVAIPGATGVSVNYGEVLAGNPLVGKKIYVYVGNGATLASSTQFAIVDTGFFIDAESGTPDSNSFFFSSVAPGGIERGSEGPTGAYNGTGSNLGDGLHQAHTLRLEVVPEPSVALLGGLGILGLVARRRRN